MNIECPCGSPINQHCLCHHPGLCCTCADIFFMTLVDDEEPADDEMTSFVRRVVDEQEG